MISVFSEITDKTVPQWVAMWALAAGIFGACKCLTLWAYGRAGGCAHRGRALGYLFLWPGMDARTFLEGAPPPPPAARDWLGAAAKTAFGCLLLWGGARWASLALAQAWIGMIGLIFILHFGAFHLLALAWQKAGAAATPIMRLPIAARTINEFWSVRWNRGFNDLARRYIFQPLRPRIGTAGAVMSAFLASGLVHEMVISLPAGAGYGLPTGYFLLQGAGVLAQRFGNWRGPCSRAFTLLVVAGPLFWLFHPPFALRVIVPFLKAIRAL